MFPMIEKIIQDGQFSGCNINIKQMPNNTLAAVLTFLLPVNVNEPNTTVDNKNNGQLDNLYALRSALTSPLLAVDTGNGLESAVEQTLSNVSESFSAGAKVLSAIDVSALVDQAASKVAKPAKTEAKPALAKSSDKKKAKTQDEPKAVTEVEQAPQVEEEPQVAEHNWEKELDSL